MTATVLPPKPAGGGCSHPLLPTAKKLAVAVLLAGGLTVALLLLAGVFTPKVATSRPGVPETGPGTVQSAEVRLLRQSRSEAAVGTVRAVHEAAVASRLLARVTEVRVKAGQPVTAGEVLVQLDDTDLKARWKQAEAAAVAARAARERAGNEYERAGRLLSDRAVSREEFDRAATAVRTAAADLDRAESSAREAQALLDYATVRAPITGIVVDKRVEAGDTASPGQVLLTVYNPERMQMLVSVPESLALRLKVGQKVRGRLEALDHECDATVSEIVPEAQAATRSFTVKVTGPCPPGVYSGMFGRIFIPLDEEDVVVVPAAALLRVGQLDMVRVREAGGTRRRMVQLGRRFGDDVEVLAGLRPGERVVLEQHGRETRP